MYNEYIPSKWYVIRNLVEIIDTTAVPELMAVYIFVETERAVAATPGCGKAILRYRCWRKCLGGAKFSSRKPGLQHQLC